MGRSPARVRRPQRIDPPDASVAMVARSLSEAEKMRQMPGIVYVDGPAGRRAHVDGTGLDVFEIIKTYCNLGRDAAALDAVYDWLAPEQVQAALSFYDRFPAEVDQRLELERQVWTQRFGTNS